MITSDMLQCFCIRWYTKLVHNGNSKVHAIHVCANACHTHRRVIQTSLVTIGVANSPCKHANMRYYMLAHYQYLFQVTCTWPPAPQHPAYKRSIRVYLHMMLETSCCRSACCSCCGASSRDLHSLTAQAGHITCCILPARHKLCSALALHAPNGPFLMMSTCCCP
jgi:hypothetical protein